MKVKTLFTSFNASIIVLVSDDIIHRYHDPLHDFLTIMFFMTIIANVKKIRNVN